MRLPFQKGGRPLRIGYGRIFHEGNAFTPFSTSREDMTRFHYLRGTELAEVTTLRGHELKGYLRHAELSGFVQAARFMGDVETVPLISALGVPSGPLSTECFEWLRTSLREAIAEAGELDAVYLALHGSTQVRGAEKAPEGILIGDVQELLGDKPIAASFDLHGNLSSSIVDPLTILTAYRTNPHRDLLQTGFRAGTRLIRALRGEIVPTHAWRKLPMVLGGGITVDLLSPMRQIFRRFRDAEKDPAVLAAHLFMVHPYNDAKDLGWALHVTTDGDQPRADALADELAQVLWDVRKVEFPRLRAPSEAIQEVKDAWVTKTGPISIVDTGDVVGAGAPGGSTHLLDALLRDGSPPRCYVPLCDPAAVDATWDVPFGTEVDLTLMGVEATGPQPKVPIHATVAARTEGEFGKVVRLDAGPITIAVASRPPYSVSPKFWRKLGLRIRDAEAIVQKAFFHYRFFYALVSRGNIGVATAGASSLDNVRNLPFDTPMWPKDDVADWRSFDRAKRLTVNAAPAKQSASA
ncbi:MAG: M81 family metallopeptidase [Myxococcota bacterium]